MMLLLSLLLPLARAQDPVPEARLNDVVAPSDEPAPGGLTFIGLYQARAATSNVVTTSPVFDGQVVGVLGGPNGTAVYAEGITDSDGDGEPDDDLANTAYIEQRLNTFFTYAPPVLDGRASMTAGFEIDFLFGDDSYGVGGNSGGGYGADQVNLQTRRLHTTVHAVATARHHLDAVVGLQFVGDGAYNPAASTLDDLIRTGGGLRFFGSELSGVTLYGRYDDDSGERLRYKLGSYTLSEGGVSSPDDIGLHMLDVQLKLDWASRLGAHAWVMRDRAGGDGGLLGTGPASTLSELQGGPALSFGDDGAPAEVSADLVWLALDGGINHTLTQGRLGASGLALANLGRLYVTDQEDADVQGWLVSGEARYRWGVGRGSVLRLEALLDSRDGTDQGQYTGVITGNSYGIVGAVWSTHGALLLLPDPKAINRQIAVVSDVSNQGYGMLALAGGGGWDISPNRLNLSLGGAYVQSPAADLGAAEYNARLTWSPMLFWELSVAGAAALGTNFDADPWLVQAYLEWLHF